MEVSLPESSTKHIKSLCTNHPCALCDTYGHYSHHCPCIPSIGMLLRYFHQLDSIHQTNPTPMTNSQPTIEIGPPEVHTSENSMQILYLSHSMGLKLSENLPFSTRHTSEHSHLASCILVSTLVAPLSTSLPSTSLDEAYVNHVSHSHGRGVSTPFLQHEGESFLMYSVQSQLGCTLDSPI
jgi:hypothetical protein